MISIVIPAYNEGNSIGTCLNSLTRLTTREPLEIIIVDNNSSDETADIVRSYQDRLPLQLTYETYKGRGAARAKGFSLAKGEIIFSTDADAQVPSRWIDAILPFFRDLHVVAFSGTCVIEDCSFITNNLHNSISPLIIRGYRFCTGYYLLYGFNSAIRKEAYERAGGFPTYMNASEDVRLSSQIRNLGKTVFSEDVPVIACGRRYKNGYIRGSLSYVDYYVRHFILGNHSLTMTDER